MKRAVERYQNHEGILVGRRATPSGDLLLSVVTPQGALQMVARRAQRPSGRSGRLSLFHHLSFQIYQKPGSDWPTLTQAELVGRLGTLEQPQRFACAAFLGELAYRLASPEVAARVWPLLVSGLKGIARQPDSRVPLIWAGWRILQAAGLAPNLSGEGSYLRGGQLAHQPPGILLDSTALTTLSLILTAPGSEAVAALERQPSGMLLAALKDHAAQSVGGLNSLVMLPSG
jgi:DNA repair protein RecO (recombination protein O)